MERVKQIMERFLEFWNKYTKTQKAIILSVIAALILAFLILFYLMSRTEYVQIYQFEDNKSAAEFVKLLEAESIKYKLDDDGVTVSVDSKSYEDAMIVMGVNDIQSSGMSWEDALNNSMATTQSEKDTKYQLAFQNQLREELLTFDNVQDATVHITVPDEGETIFAEQEDTSVSVMLTLKDNISSDAAAGMAKMLASAVGNTDTSKITIISTSGVTLFDGSNAEGLGGSIGSVAEYKEKLRNTFRNNIKELMIGYGFDDAIVSTDNYQFNMDKVTELYNEYTPAEGQEQGVLKNDYTYKSIGSSGSGGIPGTDSNNDDTDYMTQDGSSSSTETDLTKHEYQPNERSTTTEYEQGAVNLAESSISLVLKTYRVYDQAACEKDGTLGNLSWEEFKAQNAASVPMNVSDELLTFVSTATGISNSNITISSWEVPIFNDTVKEKKNFSNYLMIILAVLIVALLIFVVFKGTAPVEVTELEPELSVEQLLATTKENQSLDDIEFSDSSETRKMIEKFVDENPEAVAQLLRNWLNDDWG
ncbi:MAG: flagellar M-ring protein FliF C-terminal domain-containing protein [Clostridiales bacterium]|nr:flagellar M-ring protein FliF C-terminal domain-containing protein [Clostridiales bacterium]